MTIEVKIIADSISPEGVRLTTFELEYPRFIHAEIMTHRVFSRNAQSSRAVPVAKGLEQPILSPVVWGKNKAGMSSDESLSPEAINEVSYYWNSLARYCQDFAERMATAGLHKQWANRCLEWFSPIKVVVTATEWDNFLWLRDDPEAAQPEIVELARKIKQALAESDPQLLQPGEWHLPYINSTDNIEYGHTQRDYYVPSEDGFTQVSLEIAKKLSASACAQVSYRRLDLSLDKALEIYEKLFNGPKPHLSPVEHQATPVSYAFAHFPQTNPTHMMLPSSFEAGVTHCTRNSELWSGNFRGWIQQRQLMNKEQE